MAQRLGSAPQSKKQQLKALTTYLGRATEPTSEMFDGIAKQLWPTKEIDTRDRVHFLLLLATHSASELIQGWSKP